eukprot:6928073-Lingulodinium_polyedra.AAC.1
MHREDISKGALRQSDWGREDLKPTRFLGRLPGLGGILFPIPYKPMRDLKRLIGHGDGGFKTAAAAPWPPQLCRKLSELA